MKTGRKILATGRKIRKPARDAVTLEVIHVPGQGSCFALLTAADMRVLRSGRGSVLLRPCGAHGHVYRSEGVDEKARRSNRTGEPR